MLTFVSYAREDARYRDTFLKFAAPYERANHIELYHDVRQPANKLWEEDLANAIHNCGIGVLLLTSAFVSSSYCMNKEFGALHERFMADQCMILAVRVSPFQLPDDALLRRHQWIPSDKPITKYSGTANQETQWSHVAKELGRLAASAYPLDSESEKFSAGTEDNVPQPRRSRPPESEGATTGDLHRLQRRVEPRPGEDDDSAVAYTTTARTEICRLLVFDWPALADQLGFRAYEIATFTRGHEARRMWDILEQRHELRLLRPALKAIGRDDLVRELDNGLIYGRPGTPESTVERLFDNPFIASDSQALTIETSDLRAALRQMLSDPQRLPQAWRGKRDTVQALVQALDNAIKAPGKLGFNNSLTVANRIRERLRRALSEAG
ncbi:TIR domain-containing protein [Sphaerisporangium sp. NPDC004334]